MATKANELEELIGSIPDDQLVIVPDPATGHLLRSTWGQMKTDVVLALGGLSYLDDIIEVATVADLPQPGQTKKIYVITTGVDANKQFRWGGSIYIEFPQGSGDVASEAIIRGNNDALLQTNINTETAARIAGDAANAGSITAEATARANADTTLQTNINAEANTRANADAALSTRINAEATARAAADQALSDRIDALGNSLYNGIAGEALGGGKLVYVASGKVYLYDASDITLADRAIGFTKAAAVADAAIAVQIDGVFVETGMGLTPGENYYAALAGLISTNPVQAVCVMVGTAITADSIKIEIQQSIITA